MDEIRPNIGSLFDFYSTSIYRETQSLFENSGIQCLDLRHITNGPSVKLLSNKIYCEEQRFTRKTKCSIQFPVFLIDKHINQLKQLMSYQTFIDHQIWIQYYYFNVANKYRICDSLPLFTYWYEIINLTPYILIIRNSCGDGNVICNKVKTVALAELNKSQSYEYSIKQMNKFFTKHCCYLVIAMSIHKTYNQTQHFDAIVNEIHRHISSNINDQNHKYKPSKLREHTLIDYKTQMTFEEYKWNLPKHWRNDININNNNNNNNNCAYIRKAETNDLFQLSLEKVVRVSQSYYNNSSRPLYNSYNNKATRDNIHNNNSLYYSNNNNINNNNNKSKPQKSIQYDYSSESAEENEQCHYPQNNNQYVEYNNINNINNNNTNNMNIKNEEYELNYLNSSPMSSPTYYNPSPEHESCQNNINDNMSENINENINENIDELYSTKSDGEKENKLNRQNNIFQSETLTEKQVNLSEFKTMSLQTTNGPNNKPLLHIGKTKYHKYVHTFVQSHIDPQKYALICKFYSKGSSFQILESDDSKHWVCPKDIKLDTNITDHRKIYTKVTKQQLSEIVTYHRQQCNHS